MATNYPGALDSYTTKVDNVDDVMAAHINDPQDAIEALEAQHQTRSLIKVKNTSGATVYSGNLAYIDEAGELKTTSTAYLDAAWCVVIAGGANNAQVVVCRRGRITVFLNGNCSIGDYLYTSTTATQAQPQSYVRPEVFAVALTANASGAGGTCEALLLTGTTDRTVAPGFGLYSGVSLSQSDFVSTIATLPGGAVLTYGAVTSGDEFNLVPVATTQIAKMVLHNTTRGDDALILNSVTGTNTITLTANVPGTWQVGDTITIRSQTNTANPAANVYYIDFEIISALDTLARYITISDAFGDTGAASVISFFHPYTANADTEVRAIRTQVANVLFDLQLPAFPIHQNRFCLAWDASGANTVSHYPRLRAEGVATP